MGVQISSRFSVGDEDEKGDEISKLRADSRACKMQTCGCGF